MPTGRITLTDMALGNAHPKKIGHTVDRLRNRHFFVLSFLKRIQPRTTTGVNTH